MNAMEDQEAPGLEEIDRLVRAHMELGRVIQEQMRERDAQVRPLARKMREVAEPFERELAALREKRRKNEETILGLWRKHHGARTTLDLPSARVIRRNCRELVVNRKRAVLAALDKADRLDLVTQVIDESAVAKLIAQGKLPGLPPEAAEVIDHLNIRAFPKGATNVQDPAGEEGAGIPAED